MTVLPNLGLATNRELFAEMRAREQIGHTDPDYRTSNASFDYMAEADKTCSVVFHPEYVDQKEFTNFLHSFASIAEAINLRKKLLFRGKTPKDVGTYHPNLAGSLAVEFDPNNIEPDKLNVLHGLVGIITEAGEMAEVLLRWIETGKLDDVNVTEEAGDVLWYLARLGRGVNLTIDQIGEINIDKLRGRHGTSFDVFRDANRDLSNERKRLERETMNRDADMFEASARIDAERVTRDPERPCLGDNIHAGPPGAIWEDGCWRASFKRDIPGLA